MNTRKLAETMPREGEINMKVSPKHLFLLFLATTSIIIGIVFILNSTNWGFHSAERFLGNRGGMDTNQFNIIIKSKIESYEYLGAILTLLGGMFLLFTILSKDFLIEEINNGNKEVKDSAETE
ncbi:hypothetical protein [Cohnella herbarum]|uniref:Uncharacterized protein n=1 Tax=Cohnella herbarum TaxID=2728023 RepID=A0A7Z2ZK74_9BACL|nr:hypothetical protein [Cohnella herbarum]QJD82911.1 hypothetical protein HH215_06780 [Cohnella herbarum]